MELRVLRYFLAVAYEGSISNAAKVLHVTQPTLSRQIADLEKELGKQLLIRGRRHLNLTEEGILLRERAEQIVELADRTQEEIQHQDNILNGNVFIGCGETEAMLPLIRTIQTLRRRHPGVRYHLFDGSSSDLDDRLDKGLLDFLIECELIEHPKYDSLVLPHSDTWGVLMLEDDSLAQREAIKPTDLCGKPIVCSRQALQSGVIERWAGACFARLDVVATFNIVLNSTMFVREGVAYVLTYDKLIDVPGSHGFCFRPLDPRLTSTSGIIWKRDRHLSRAARLFLDELRAILKQE